MRPIRDLCGILLAASLAALPASVTATEAAAGNSSVSGPPAWAKQEMSGLIGTWIAPERADQHFEAYGIEWKWGLAQRNVSGRLFAIRDGKEVGSMWTFWVFWHPGTRELVLQQLGTDGTFGVGSITIAPDGWSEVTQVFHEPDGRKNRVLHRSQVRGDERFTESYELTDQGERKARPAYRWKRQPPDR